ncbi:hypothetical protein J3F83DRAFT_156209 [Trichoderma novae-zelandiae]
MLGQPQLVHWLMLASTLNIQTQAIMVSQPITPWRRISHQMMTAAPNTQYHLLSPSKAAPSAGISHWVPKHCFAARSRRTMPANIKRAAPRRPRRVLCLFPSAATLFPRCCFFTGHLLSSFGRWSGADEFRVGLTHAVSTRIVIATPYPILWFSVFPAKRSEKGDLVRRSRLPPRRRSKTSRWISVIHPNTRGIRLSVLRPWLLPPLAATNDTSSIKTSRVSEVIARDRPFRRSEKVPPQEGTVLPLSPTAQRKSWLPVPAAWTLGLDVVPATLQGTAAATGTNRRLTIATAATAAPAQNPPHPLALIASPSLASQAPS